MQNQLKYDLPEAIFPQIKAQGVNEALYKALWLLDDMEEVPSRDGTTKELLNCRLIHTEPRDRIIRLQGRKHNFFSQLGETLWVLSGSNELRFLNFFLPRAKEFSDDGGRTWRSGYGARLRGYPKYDWDPLSDVYTEDEDGVDQFRSVIESIVRSRETRRGFIVLTHPPVDHAEGIDVVCNVALQFIVRRGRLCMTIHNRSNDVIWGYSGINFFEFTFMQELMRSILLWDYGVHLELGPYVHNSVSFHLYSRHYERAQGILTKNAAKIEPFSRDRHFPVSVPSLEAMDQNLSLWQGTLEYFRQTDNLTDEELLVLLGKFFVGDISKNTLLVYILITLIYVVKKHKICVGSMEKSFHYWRSLYMMACERCGLNPYNTYFLTAVLPKLQELDMNLEVKESD